MLNKLTDYDNKDSLVNRIRNARFQFFEERLKALGPGPKTMLDVGGYERFWINRGYAGGNGDGDLHITLLNLTEEPTHYPNIVSVKGNACDMREFADRQFDVVFSNSVIEHLHSYENQQAMAREVQRVGRYHFVQTPNRYFVMEPHFLIPWFQFMPRALQYAILTKTSLARFKKLSAEDANSWIDEVRLLSKQEFSRLFPQSRMYIEKFFGTTKSFTAHNM
jgi:predicted SAM-dependent methyltransferase